MVPHAQQDKLLVQEVEDELVVYDQRRDRAHRLNRTAALIWRHCDGRNSLSDLAELVQRELNSPVDLELVWLGLDRLGKAGLLRKYLPRTAADANLSRRHMIRRLGRVGALAVLLPAVSSIIAPSPLMAATGGPGQCAGCCRFKVTVIYDFTKDAAGNKKISRIDFRPCGNDGKENIGSCNADVLVGTGKVDFKVREREAPCRIRDGPQWTQSPTTCGTEIEGVSVLRMRGDFEWIDIEVTLPLTCSPSGRCRIEDAPGECEGNATRDSLMFKLSYDGRQVTHDGSEPPDEGNTGTKTVTWRKELPCQGSCVPE